MAADTAGAVCDVPTLLLSRLPGRPPGLPADMGTFLTQLAAALPAIHAVDSSAQDRVPGYRSYYDLHSAFPPSGRRVRSSGNEAIPVASKKPPEGRRCFIHRDYHPENTLWWRSRLTGIVDWTSGSWGPAAVDTAHMRWNLALTYGLDAAEAFLRQHRLLTGQGFDDQHHWDLVTVLDLVAELDPGDWSAFDLARLELYVESVLADLG